MNRLIVLISFLVLAGAQPLTSQVLTPAEVLDPSARQLQQRHFKVLMEIGTDIEGHRFPYPFYLSRVLDVDLKKMPEIDQRSIRFDSYNHQMVLEITGNYYASYSGQMMEANARFRETFKDVIMPVLKAEVAHFADDSVFSAYAIEVSHHVRQKAMGMASENAENVTAIIPFAAAQKLVDATNDDQKQGAILDSELFLNGEPFTLWVKDGSPPEDWKADHAPPVVHSSNAAEPAKASSPGPNAASTSSTVASSLLKPTSMPVRIFTPEDLNSLQSQNQVAINRIVSELDHEAHFLPYAAPLFVGFRQGAYLQLSLATPLHATAETSRYKLAALAFDEHIATLVRPILDFLPAEANFDGVAFSTVLHLSDASANEAVEFFLPIRTMRCFAAYDCTGQQLIDSGTILINGERATLNLEIAEGKN